MFCTNKHVGWPVKCSSTIFTLVALQNHTAPTGAQLEQGKLDSSQHIKHIGFHMTEVLHSQVGETVGRVLIEFYSISQDKCDKWNRKHCRLLILGISFLLLNFRN